MLCIGRTDDMLIVRGVNVYPSAVEDVVAAFAPRTTGRIEILLDGPGPAVEPPVRLRVEHTASAGDLGTLQRELESRLRETLAFRAAVELTAEGTLPRGEYKRQLIRRAGAGSRPA